MQLLVNTCFVFRFKNMVKLDQHYWESRYLEGQTGWDVGYPTTPLKVYIDQLSDKSAQILIPGAGNAYEAKYLSEQGFKNVTIVDISPTAIANVKLAVGESIKYISGDFFEHEGKYDLILEQTFFCAIDPSLRSTYVSQTAALLKDEGKLVGLLWSEQMNKGTPPFGGNEEEYTALFKSHFKINYMAKAYNSISARQDRELFINFSKKKD